MSVSPKATEGAGKVTRWLVVGHGSVGSALVRRIGRTGVRPFVYDPSPRVVVTGGERLTAVDERNGPFDAVVSCVVPSAAPKALEAVRSALGQGTLYLEWNTITPDAKRAIAEAAPCRVVDVALLDTLDDEAAHPSLAVSGAEAAAAVSLLSALGFSVDVVGALCGDAALLKLARSLFMKSLEALVIEFEAAMAHMAGRDVVIRSIERNLGPQFITFSRMLLETDRIHAGRRSVELQEAVESYRRAGRSVEVPSAAIRVLQAAAASWRAAGAPAPDAGAPALAEYLARYLARQHEAEELRHAGG
jgi:4-hydroxy-4-methyl-2-oxoglutarate aldolase